jgi:hypothetical protein
VVYGIAGYIEADSQGTLPGSPSWMRPHPNVWPNAAMTTFAAVLLLGWSIDRWRARRRPAVQILQNSN